MPVVLPPLKDQSDPASYYAGIADPKNQGVIVSVTDDNGAFDITVTNSDKLHPSDQFDTPLLPLSSVFAPTAGFASFYPSSFALPTPDHQPLADPAGLISTNIGSVMIRVWIADYDGLAETPSAAAPRANRIVLGWLQQSTVQTAFTAQIAKLSLKVLTKAWTDANPTGTPPDETALAAAFLANFMAGKAEVFVAAGDTLGSAAIVGTSPEEVATVKLLPFFQPPDPAPPVIVEADDLIDNADAQSKFASHPVFVAANASLPVTFKSTFTIWDNNAFEYVPLVKADKTGIYVRLMKATAAELKDGTTLMSATAGIEVDHATTDANGAIDLTVNPLKTLRRSDWIFFEYDIDQQTFGSRTISLTDVIRTDAHRAKRYLTNNINNHTYKAKYELYPHFKRFVDSLATNQEFEMYMGDRGNGSEDDTRDSPASLKYALTYSSQKGFLMQIQDSEQRYKQDILPPMFNLLVEGDSWLHYPPDRNDIYGHLDGMLHDALSALKPPPTYIRFPLQHYGDRSDHMFVGVSSDDQRQWHYTYDVLKEYKIDLVLCSAGGNDLADQGISNWLVDPGVRALGRKPDESPVAAAYIPCFTESFDSPVAASNPVSWATFNRGGYFSPFLMAGKSVSPDDQATAEAIMDRSFAILLNNHPWNLYRNGKTMNEQQDGGSLYIDLDQDLMAVMALLPLGTDFGESDPKNQRSKREEIGQKVIANFKLAHEDDFPDQNGDPAQKLLATVFDSNKYTARFVSIKKNWQVLLDAARDAGTFVISHTYCYPLFSDQPTRLIIPRRGPWFAPRFDEARITDLRIRCVCLKAMIDNYVGYVLAPLKKTYSDVFDYVDVRESNSAAIHWTDEIHLASDGFEQVAQAIFDKAAGMPRFKKFLG